MKGKVQEWCRLMWMGVEMWERGRRLEMGFVLVDAHDRTVAKMGHLQGLYLLNA
jgi:hypothetical protein